MFTCDSQIDETTLIENLNALAYDRAHRQSLNPPLRYPHLVNPTSHVSRYNLQIALRKV